MSPIDDFPAYAEKMFGALSCPNPIMDAHSKALEQQELFHKCDGTDEEKSDLANHIIRELDDTCNHVGQKIAVTGTAYRRSFDLGAVDFDKGVVTESSIQKVYLDDAKMQSMGYEAIPQNDGALNRRLAFYHIASTGIQEVLAVANTKMYRQDTVFIPVDGTAEVTPINSSQEAHIPLLEWYIPGLLGEVKGAIPEDTSATYALRALAKIDLTNYSEALGDDELSSELMKYMNGLLPLHSTVPCAISGINSLSRHDKDTDKLTPVEVDPEFIITGHIYELAFMPKLQVIGEEQTPAPQFCLMAILPLNDDGQLTLDTVHIPLSDTIIVDPYPVLKTKPLQS